MIADATDPLSGWLQLCAPLGVAGILAWHLYYATSVLMPKLMERVDLICSNHDKTLMQALAKFGDELKEERLTNRETVKLIAEKFVCKK